MKTSFIKLGLLAMFVLIGITSCSSSGTLVHLMCDEQQVEIFVDDNYVGRGLVQYTVPKGNEYMRVSCREGGVEVYSREFYVKGKKNRLFELSIPKDYRFSTGQ